MIAVLLFVLWYLVGTVPVILMWRTQKDITYGDLAFILLMGLSGPGSVIGCWMIMMPTSTSIIIPKRRRP